VGLLGRNRIVLITCSLGCFQLCSVHITLDPCHKQKLYELHVLNLLKVCFLTSSSSANLCMWHQQVCQNWYLIDRLKMAAKVTR